MPLWLLLWSAVASAAPTATVDATPGWLGDLAFDSSRNRWLVVSHAGPVYGRLMGNDAKPAGEAFVLSAPDHKQTYSPLAAYAPDADKYLVVWMDFSKGADMYGRFVSGAGVLSPVFSISTADVPGVVMLNVGGDRTSALRYDGANKRWVLVWEQRDGGSRTKLTTIDPKGNRGAVIEVGTWEGQGNWGPSVAVNEAKNEYCVAYDQRNTRRYAMTRVDAKTLAQGKESVTAMTTVNVDIAYNAKAKKYMYLYDAGYEDGVHARFLTNCAFEGGSDVKILPKQGYSSAAANEHSGRFAAIGQDGQDYGNFYSVTDASGKKLSRQNRFSGSRKGNYLPVIRANTKDGTFAATSSRDYEMTRFVARLGSGESVEEIPDTPPEAESETLRWRWDHPAANSPAHGEIECVGESTADVVRVEILVNKEKVGEAVQSEGRWRYTLDPGEHHGGFNLSAVVYDADHNHARYTIRIGTRN